MKRKIKEGESKEDFWKAKKHIMTAEEHGEFMKKSGMTEEEHEKWHKEHGGWHDKKKDRIG